MKRNIYGAAAVGAVAVAVLTLSACMVPQAPPGMDQGSAASGSQGLGRGGLQGQAPYGADPDAYFHRLSSVGQGG